MLIRCITILFALLLFLAIMPFAAAQENGSVAKEEENAKVPPPKITPQEPRTQIPENDTSFIPQRIPDLIIIKGSVITEDGNPPPFGTVITRDCGSEVTNEVLVSANGFFSFIVGDKNRASGLFADASENYFDDRNRNERGYSDLGNNSGPLETNYEADLFGCVLLARYDGYRSTYAQLGVNRRSGLIDVGTIILYPASRIKGTAVSITNLTAPKEAKKALKKGKEAFEKDAFKKAEKYYRTSIDLYPEYSEAWVELGWLYQKLKRNDEAKKAYQKASDADKSYISPYIRFAQLYALEQRWKKSVEYSEEALFLDPVSYPQAYFMNGLAHYRMNQLDRAEEVIRRGIRIDLNNQMPKMHLILANILARKNDPSGSMDSRRRYLEIVPNAADADLIRTMIKAQEKNIRASHETDLPDLK